MIQVYTGDGKGKTTASLGLALRAVGAGLKVYIAQFIKNGTYSELKAIKKIKNIKIEQFGNGCFIRKKPTLEDTKIAEKGFKKIKEIISAKKYNLIILDEINVALSLNLLKTEDVLDLIKNTPAQIELVFTGRNAPSKIIKIADLVSRINNVKHYYKKKYTGKERHRVLAFNETTLLCIFPVIK